MVKAGLLDAVERAQFREDDRGRPERVHQLKAGHGPIGADQAAQLTEHPLGRDTHELAGAGPRQRHRLRLGGEAELRREPGQAQDAQRILSEGRG